MPGPMSFLIASLLCFSGEQNNCDMYAESDFFPISEPCSIADSLDIQFVGSWPFSYSWAAAADTVRNLAFCGSGAGVLIYDVSNPDDPQKISDGIRTLGSRVENMFFDQSTDMLYVDPGENFIEIWDVQDPANPSKVTTINVYGNAQELRVRGNYLYVVAVGLRIFDISNPWVPVEMGLFYMNGIECSLEVQGDYAYVVDSENELKTVNVSNGWNPYQVSGIENVHIIQLEIEDQVLYAIGSGSQLYAFDISAPEQPVLLSYTELPFPYFTQLDVSSGLAVISYDIDHIVTVDVSSPESPVVLGSLELSNYAYVKSISILGTEAYMAAATSGFLSVDLSDPVSPAERWALQMPGNSWRIEVSENIAYVGNSSGLFTLDVSDPEMPVYTGFWESDHWVVSLVLNGDHAYILNNYTLEEGFLIIDISDPSAPVQTGYYDTVGDTEGMELFGNYLFCALDEDGVEIVDVSDPANPVHVSQFTTGSDVYCLCAVGSILYLDCGAGIEIWDISNVFAPVPMGLCYTGSLNGMKYSDGYLFLTRYYDGLLVMDVSDPMQPVPVDSCAVGEYASGLALDGDIAYVRDHNNSFLHAVDISDPTDVTVLASSTVPDNPYDIYCQAGHAYVAASHCGLQIYTYSETGIEHVNDGTPLCTVFPLSNPCSSAPSVRFTIPEDSHVELGIYDLTGRRLDTLADGFYPAGTHLLEGGSLPVGSYLIVLRNDQGVFSGKLVVLE